jgi:hypothetical protein
MYWYRVELNSSGNVVACTQLERCGGPEDSNIFYVWAPDEQRAKRTAYEGYVANQRRLSADRRVRLKTEKKCTQCGSDMPKGDDRVRCATCRLREYDAKQRHAARKAGKEVTAPSKRVAHAETKARRDRQQRRAMLIEVRKAWRKAQTDEQFSAWLDARIKECKTSFWGAS